jgi:hypothetical protein
MMARAGPEIAINPPHNMPPNYQTSAPIWPTKSQKSGRKSAPKITRNGDTPIHHASDRKRKVSAVKLESRLSIAETTYRGKKAWRVSLGKRGRNLISFRIRPINSGFVVTWRTGKAEPYMCYLSAAEWGTAKKGSSANFARLIVSKLDARRDAGETLDRIADLNDFLKAFV